MQPCRVLLFICALTAGSFFGKAKAQTGLCPPNLDFEFGDFTNWICRAGAVAVVGGVNTYTWSSVGPPIPGKHTMIDVTTAGIDPYGRFPQLCPNGSSYTVKLGNTNAPPGRQATGISYTYAIPVTANVFSIFYHYAVVLQNPTHTPEEQPRFRARITDLSTNSPLPCVTFDFTASSSLPGFLPSPINPTVLYKDWTPITLNLSGYAGRTIELEFITTDCTLGGHFGYAYVDVNSACNGVISGNTICIGDTSITMTAPFGFQQYTWYSDNTFSTILATTQTLTLSPPPTVGSVFPVVVGPYPGFGCVDTLYATIAIAPKPVSIAGPDVDLCVDQTIQIGGPPTTAYTYSWTPASQVSNPFIPDPIAWDNPPGPTQFIVKTTDILTGCSSFDTTVLSTIIVDTAIRITGKSEYCVGDPLAGILSVNGSSTAVQWYDAAGPIAGATSTSYQPTVSGNYWASLTQQGCADSTGLFPIFIHPLPQANFTPIIDTGCVTSNLRTYTNASTTSDGAAMSYVWKFSDGDIQTTQDAIKTFTGLGSYTVELVTTTQYGCKDSITGTINMFPNGTPNFTWDSICINRPMLFTNLSQENGSPLVNYNWTFNDGGPGSSVKDPPPVTYTTPGRVDVTLQQINLGCENDPKSVTQSVLVNKPADGIRYRDLTVPLGSSQFIHVRGDIGDIYNWRPAIQLSSYTTRYTEFFAVSDDVKYLIDITDEHTCVTTDTMQVYILKKPGYYLPTAFTPNGDGLNDVVRPYLVGMKSLKSFSIFNRWGNLIFNSTTEGEGWNGKFRGEPQPNGVYVWVLQYIDASDKLVVAKGTITLIR